MINSQRQAHRYGFLVLLLCAALGAGCVSRRAQPQGRPGSFPGVDPATLAPGDGFAPAPTLQGLMDPYPSEPSASWLGGDVASSIQLSDARFAWIFGDSLLGSVRANCGDRLPYCDRRAEPDEKLGMIANSVGITERSADGSFGQIVKYWRQDGATPAPIFAAEEAGEILWPLAGVRVGPYLLIAANQHTREAGLVPVGNLFLRVENPDHPPDRWLYTRYPVPNFIAADHSTGGLTWTTAFVYLGRYIYVLGSLGEAKTAHTVLARLHDVEVMEAEWSPRPEYLVRNEAGDLVWSPRFSVERLHRVRGLPGTSEATVDHHTDLGWYSYRLPPLSFAIHLYTAPDLEGPWRDSGAVYSLPAPWSTTPPSDCAGGVAMCGSRYIAYAVKAHPELAPAGGAVLSYNVNIGSGSLEQAMDAAATTEGFYVPQIILGPSSARAAP